MRWLVLALVLVARAAHAQAPGELPVAQLPPAEFDDKSVGTAYIWSIGATTLPMIATVAIVQDDHARGEIFPFVAMTALTFGPSLGHWYAGEMLPTGFQLRILGLGTMISAIAYDPYETHPNVSVPALILGAVAFDVGVAWDFVTLPRAVRRYNKAHQLAPIMTSNGVAIAGRF